jgi:hypothetical protein
MVTCTSNERFFLYCEKLCFTIILILLKEIVKTGRTAGNEDVFEVAGGKEW